MQQVLFVQVSKDAEYLNMANVLLEILHSIRESADVKTINVTLDNNFKKEDGVIAVS